MADINLNDLLQAHAESEAAPAALQEVNPELEIMQVTQTVSNLTPAERQQVEEIKNSIDLVDAGKSLQFGGTAQKAMADFSDSILSQVRAKDSGHVGDLLNDLSTKINEFSDSQKSSFVESIPIIGSLVSKGKSLKASYETLATKISKIQSELEQSKMTMMKDIALFDKLYEQNVQYFKNLQLYIQAGEEKLTELRTVTLPKLKADAAQSNNPMAGQVVSDFESNVDRFEKKIHDLKISKTIAIQTAPQLRLIQNNDKLLVERIQSAIYNAIPLWKNQIVIALGLTRQQQVLQQQRAISDTTNKLLLQNAEMLKTNSIETAKENARSVVDIDTVKKVNDDLVSTIEETIKIQREGREKRIAAEQELVQIENRLKEVLLQNTSH
ncbi:MAG: toxic anion resistance protein [Selenomonadaceae bacterium]|nr:toxic anion resistance protein [Selenomonadaceae bacterium]MDD6397288.1 toxic anion resistance protein [Selenomonadaceae bacterium]